MADRIVSEETYQLLKNSAQELLEAKQRERELKARLAEANRMLAEANRMFDEIYGLVIDFGCAFGIGTPDGTAIRPEIISGEENPMLAVTKNIGDLVMKAAAASTSPKIRAQLEKKFEFVKKLPPIIEYYGRK